MKKVIRALLVIFIFITLFGSSSCKNGQKIENYNIKVEYTEERLIGSMQYEWVANKEKRVVFNLYPNAFFKSSSVLTVSDIKINQENAQWEYLNNNEYLCVYLPQNIKNGANVCLNLNFECSVLQGKGRLGNSGKVVNLAYFYPVRALAVKEKSYSDFGDPFYCSFANHFLSITLPSVYTVACGAEVVGIELKGQKTTYSYLLKNAKTLALSFSENYAVISKKWGYKRVNYYYYNDNSPDKTLETVIDCLKFLSEKIGEYAYSCLTVAISPFESGGMEYPAFVVVGESENESAFKNALIHEVCHQYFPVAISVNEYLCGYLDEGLTEFLTYSYLDSKEPGIKKAHALYATAMQNAYKKAQEKIGAQYNGVMEKDLSEFYNGSEYTVCAYYKGFLLFYKMERDGVDIFKYLKRAYGKNKFTNISSKQFIQFFKGSGKRVENIFEQFVFGGEDIIDFN